MAKIPQNIVEVTYNPYSQTINFTKSGKKTESAALKKLSNQKEFFLQAKMECVIEGLLKAYDGQGRGGLQVKFNGTEQDFKEFESACESHGDNRITAIHGIKLPLPTEQKKIIDKTFEELGQQFIPELQKQNPQSVESSIDKYKKLSNNNINVIVLGTYNAGKSMLINAILGYKILPEENTDKTKFRTEIHCGEPRIKITLDEGAVLDYTLKQSNGCWKLMVNENEKVFNKTEIQNKLHGIVKEINKELKAEKNCRFEDYIYKILDMLTDKNKDEKFIPGNKAVEVWVPFDKSKINKNIVLIDTPGKDSNDPNADADFIKNIQSQSNAVPLIVMPYDAASSQNGENLDKKLKESGSNINNSRKIYIINKADCVNGKRDIDSAKKDLGSKQYMWTSALMGLGAKSENRTYNNENRTYKNNKSDFSSDKTEICILYKFNNIWNNKEITRECDEYKKSCDDKGKVYVNSGIYAVELMLNKFAENYAACYKCQKAQETVNELINKINDLKKSNKEKNDKAIKDNEDEKNKAVQELKNRLIEFKSESETRIKKFEKALSDVIEGYRGEITKISDEIDNMRKKSNNEINIQLPLIEKRIDDLIRRFERNLSDEVNKLYKHKINKKINDFMGDKEGLSEKIKTACKQKLEIPEITIPRLEKEGIFQSLLRFIKGNTNADAIAQMVSEYYDNSSEEAIETILRKTENTIKKSIDEMLKDDKMFEDKNYMIKKYTDEINKLTKENENLENDLKKLKKFKDDIYGGQA